MKKTVIAIWGAANQGKSSSIKAISAAISNYFPTAVFNRLIDVGDIRHIVQIGNIKIGMESQGDPNSRLGQSLNIFLSQSCDIIICATRSSGSTQDLVNDLHNIHNYDIIWTTNYFSNEKGHNDLNDVFADGIINVINALMSGRL